MAALGRPRFVLENQSKATIFWWAALPMTHVKDGHECPFSGGDHHERQAENL